MTMHGLRANGVEAHGQKTEFVYTPTTTKKEDNLFELEQNMTMVDYNSFKPEPSSWTTGQTPIMTPNGLDLLRMVPGTQLTESSFIFDRYDVNGMIVPQESSTQAPTTERRLFGISSNVNGDGPAPVSTPQTPLPQNFGLRNKIETSPSIFSEDQLTGERSRVLGGDKFKNKNDENENDFTEAPNPHHTRGTLFPKDELFQDSTTNYGSRTVIFMEDRICVMKGDKLQWNIMRCDME